jgi:cytochrome c oxidase subunit 2
MSIYSPPADWYRAPTGGERAWIALALSWCVVLTLAMPYWHFKGKQNSTGEAYAVTPLAYSQRVNRFVEQSQVGEEDGTPIVQGTPGGDVYLLARMWTWYPILKLAKGQTYRLHISSMDIQHGFSVVPINMNFQVLPGYDHVLTITPTSSGNFSIICNEFCGIGHHQMTGRIIVTE